MRRRLLIILVGVALFAAAAAAGFAFAALPWSEYVRSELELRLARAVGGPVHVGSARLEMGLGLKLAAEDVSLYPDERGDPRLWVRQAVATVRPLSLLQGEFRVRRLLMKGARLRLARDADGEWTPHFGPRPREEEAHVPHPAEELLGPLIALETTVRKLLVTPRFADGLEVRDSTVVFSDASMTTGGAPLTLTLEDFGGHLRHGAFLGDTRLTAAGRLFDEQGERGRVEWEGRRTRGGAIRLALATTSLEMEALQQYLRALYPRARVDGILSGAVVFETLMPGDGRLEIDLVARDVESIMRPRAETAYGPVGARRVAARAVLAISPQNVELERAHLETGNVAVDVSGVVERPVNPRSVTKLALSLRNVDFVRARNLLGWLPEAERDTLATVVKPVEAGTLVRFEADGTATLEGWEAFVTGRTLHLPMGFTGRVEVADGALRVGESNRIERLRGHATWEGDRIHVWDLFADLDGAPLPPLELTLDGVSHLFGGEAERYELVSGALPLQGLSTLWETFQSDDPDSPPLRAVLDLEIDHLEHPMFLSPIENLHATIERGDRGFHIRVSDGIWAGVPIRADADWLFEPIESVRVHVTAEKPQPRQLAARHRDGWASGRFALGPIRGRSWRHHAARGRFEAHGGEILLHDVSIELEPSGWLDGSVSLDLAEPDTVPFEASFALHGGDLASVMDVLGLGDDLITGDVDLAGSLTGWLQPEISVLNDLQGLLSIDAGNGIIRRRIPPVLAIATASQSFNPFAKREVVRYSQLRTVLEFGEGALSTRSFALDGPDLRVFATGGMELTRPPNEIDADVTIFLFRQVERAIEKIPLLNVLLLDTDENLQAAYYKLTGPWATPKPSLIPLRSLGAGPAASLLTGVPRFLLKSIQAIETMMGVKRRDEPGAVYLELADRGMRDS